MNRRMYQYRIRIPVLQPLNRALTCVGRAIASDPKNAPGTSIGWLAHDQINLIVKALNAAGRASQTKKPGVANIPSGDVSQGLLSFIFVLDAPAAPGGRSDCGRRAMPHLNARLLVGAKHKVGLAQGLAVMEAMIQIQNLTGLIFKLRVPRPNTTSVGPGPNGILAQPAPDGCPTDKGDDAAGNGLMSDFISGQTRKGQAQISGKLTGVRLYFYHDFRGKKSRDALAVAGL